MGDDPLLWLIPLAGLPLSAVFAGLGIGGGAFFVPLFLALGYGFVQATGASLILIAVLSLSASIVYLREGAVDPRLILVMEPGSALAALLTGYVAHAIPVSWLRGLFVLVLIPTAWRMFRARSAPPAALASPKRRRLSLLSTRGGSTYLIHVPTAVAASLVAGALSGLLGIGGGLVKVPAMTLLLGAPIHVAVASSALMIGVTAAFGVGGHALGGEIPVTPALVGALSVAVGARVGARYAIRLPQRTLRRVFAGALLLLAIWVGVSA
jgi:uncharacterized protein